MLAILALWPAKYVAAIVLFAALAARLDRFGEKRLASALASRRDGLDAGLALLDALAGRQMASLRYLGTVALMTLLAYPLVFVLALAWSDAFAALMLAPRDDGGAAASALAQLARFWITFGPVATLFAMGAAQAVASSLALRPARNRWARPVAFMAMTAAATVAILWALYFFTVVVFVPDAPGGIGGDLDRATSSLVYALAFQLTAGIYAYAAFLPLALALSAIAAARLPGRPPEMPPIWRIGLTAMGLMLIGDALALLL